MKGSWKSILAVGGVLFLAFLGLAAGWIYARMPSTGPDRIAAIDRVVGVQSGGAYVWIIRTSNGAALVDAGADREGKAVLKELAVQGLTPNQVHTLLITHGHFDHWAAAPLFPSAKVWIGKEDLPMVQGKRAPDAPVPSLVSRFVRAEPLTIPLHTAKDGQQIPADDVTFYAIEVPGHTPGSTMYRLNDVLFTGDSLMGRGHQLVPAPDVFSDDPALNLKSLERLLAHPFDQIADGHTGVWYKAHGKLEALLRPSPSQ